MTEDDQERVLEITAQAFNLAPRMMERARDAPVERGRVLVEGSRIQAALSILPIAHFFGGRSVRCAGIASVKVAPEARGRGLARALVREVLAETGAAGMPISTLFPSTLPTYRRVGFELAGAHVRYRVPIAAIPRPSAHVVRAWGDDAIDAIGDCYRRVAAAGNGPIDRPGWWWKERTLGRREPQEEMIYRYAVYDGERVDGYLVFTQERGSGEAQWRYSLVCRDLFWASPAAARSLLSFVAGHRSLALDLVWVGSVEEPLHMFFSEQDALLDRAFHWMMRIVDPAAALEARGYPRTVEGSVEIEVADPVVRANCGALRLELEEGRGRVRRVERAATRIGVGTLAAMYSGWLTPADAVRSGGLGGAGDREIELLTAAFAGPKPWMSDFF